MNVKLQRLRRDYRGGVGDYRGGVGDYRDGVGDYRGGGWRM